MTAQRITATEAAAGIPTEVTSDRLMAVLGLLGITHDAARNVAAVDLDPKRVRVTLWIATGDQGNRVARLVVDVPVRFVKGETLDAWRAGVEVDRRGFES